MNKFIYVLTMSLLFLLFGSNLATSKDEKFDLTQNQINYAKGKSNDRTFSKAEWLNTYILALTLSSTNSGLWSDPHAKSQASLLAAQGYLFTQKNICIKIIDPEYGEIAYECAGDQTGT